MSPTVTGALITHSSAKLLCTARNARRRHTPISPLEISDDSELGGHAIKILRGTEADETIWLITNSWSEGMFKIKHAVNECVLR